MIKEYGTIKIIGFRKFRKQPWLTYETLQVLEDKATAPKRQDTTERRRLQGVFRVKAKEDRERYYNNLADEVEEGLLFVQPMQLYAE